MNDRCQGIKRSGEPCTMPAIDQSGWCWAHHPNHAEQRRRAASKTGRSKPTAEVVTIKEELKTLKDDVLAGNVDRNDAAVVVQVYRALKDYIELERRVRETDELAAAIEELKREHEQAS